MGVRIRNAVNGAIFGAKVGAVLAILVIAVGVGILVANPHIRDRVIEENGGVMRFVGGTIAGIALFATYGALTGAIVKIIFPNRAKSQD